MLREKDLERAQRLYERIYQLVCEFETGPEGFYRLPSGHLMNPEDALRKFEKIVEYATVAMRALDDHLQDA